MKEILIAWTLLGLLSNITALAVLLYYARKYAGRPPPELKKFGRQTLGYGLANVALLALVLTTR